MDYEAVEMFLVGMCFCVIVLGLAGYISKKKRELEKEGISGADKVKLILIMAAGAVVVGLAVFFLLRMLEVI